MTGRIGGASRPIAGALRLIEARTTHPTAVDVSAYVTAMEQHCPFLAPSIGRGMTGWTVYEIALASRRDAVEADLFRAGVQAAEWVRPLTNRPHGAFVCENVVLLGEAADAGHRELMAWPHWALKHLYGPVGVMFGKFVRDTDELDRFGQRIPPPPFSFLPVRAAVRARDPRFLADTPGLAAELAVASDDGRDVFEHIPDDWKAVRAWASSLPAPEKP
ncbi:hypothetical protein [Kitasatospora sp. MAP12-22]|uniref:hypothetical protein n=1 Tax=unclassified Kitasatospora TaxID=2633591 RepID=UPI00351153C7